jgi:hypothetical protein
VGEGVSSRSALCGIWGGMGSPTLVLLHSRLEQRAGVVYENCCCTPSWSVLHLRH